MSSDPNSWKEAQAVNAKGIPWEFHKGYDVRKAKRHEGPTEFAAFQVYLRLPGTRSVTETARQTGHTAQTIRKWFNRYEWQKRAAAWEKQQMALAYRDVDKMKREAHKQAIEEFRNTSERQARIMSRVSEDLVRVLGKRIAKAEEQNEEIPLHMVSGLLRAAAGLNEQSRTAWANALGVNELLEVVEDEVEKVRVQELQDLESDPYYIEIDE